MIWENFIVIYGYKMALAIIIFFVGKKLASWVTELLVKTVAKSNSVDVTLENFLRSVVYSILIVVVILASLAQLGIETTSFVAILGAAGLAVGLAFKDTLSNISAGVMLMIFRPIKIGEFVETAGISANVESINIFHTTFKTGDNKLIIVGNAKVIASNIINYSRKETRRVDLEFGISYEDNIKVAKDIILQVASKDPRVLNEPAVPFVAVKALGDSSVNLVTRIWVKSDDYWGVYFDTIENVKLAFDEANITIPYPQLDIHSKKD